MIGIKGLMTNLAKLLTWGPHLQRVPIIDTLHSDRKKLHNPLHQTPTPSFFHPTTPGRPPLFIPPQSCLHLHISTPRLQPQIKTLLEQQGTKMSHCTTTPLPLLGTHRPSVFFGPSTSQVAHRLHHTSRRLAAPQGLATTLTCARTGTRTYAVAAPKAAQEEPKKAVFALPLDYYRVLKARRINSAEILKRHYQNMVEKPPGVGYGEAALRSRAMILKLAADCLLDGDLRRVYDQKIVGGGVPQIEVRDSDFPGAMVLLQECGEMAKVVDFGTQWLNSNPSHPDSKDVGLAMALAYCDLASDTLANDEEGVATCCNELEIAVELLSHFEVAPDLQVDILGTLKELGPQYILEQFALPDDGTNSEKKAKAMSQLKALVWEMDEDLNLSPFLGDREAFLEQARANLTAAQQIELYESRPKHINIPLMEVYDTALAYVAAGYREKWPQHIYQASAALQKIQVASMTKSNPDAMDVSVELGLCALLMGESDRAMNYLGLSPSSNKLPNEDVLAFVQEKSPSEDDMLPGVCALAERWLKETIIPNYKEMTISQTSLGEWFQSKKVAVYLQVLERGKELNLLSAASATMKLSSSVAKGISTAVSKSFSGIKGIFQKAPVQEKESVKRASDVGQLNIPKLAIPAAAIEQTFEQDGMEELRRLNSLNGFETTSSNGATPSVSTEDKPTSAHVSNGLEGDMIVDVSWEEAHTSEQKEDKLSLDPLALAAAPSNGAKKLQYSSTNGSHPEEPLVAAESTSEKSFLESPVFKAIAACGVILAAAAMGYAIANNRTHPLTRSSRLTPIQRFASKMSDIFVDSQGTLDVPLAEQLVKRWHDVKAQALGSSHNTDILADVLEGSMLKQWRDRAQYVKQDGWWVQSKTHWQYKILDLSINRVEVAKDGRTASIEARIKERAELIDQGRKADWYSTTYTVEYELAMRSEGWKISSARVVYESK